MPRGVELSKLLEDLALETGETTNANARNHVRSANTRLLQRQQEQLYEDFTWPFMRVWLDVPLQAGQRLYNFPATLDASRVEEAYVKWDRTWLPLLRLLEPPDFADFDSDKDERHNPQMRWYLRDDDKFEVWPVPSGNDGVVRFVGIRKLKQLVNDADRCDLDSNVIVLRAAVTILSRRKGSDAQIKAGEAERLLQQQKNRWSPSHGFNFLGYPGNDQGRQPIGPKPIPVDSGP